MKHWLCLLAVCVSACGGSAPMAPTPIVPTQPTMTSVRIDGSASPILTGYTTSYTATALYANGTTQPTSVTWASSAPSVGSVDAVGVVSGRTHGTITLTASGSGFTASRSINIVQNYGGKWSGTYVVASCDQSGGFLQYRWCQGAALPGTRGPFSLNLGQFGNDASRIGGQIAIGQIAGEVSGTVTADGRLVIGGTYVSNLSGTLVQITIGGWETRATAADSMTGGWAQNYVLPNIAGNAYQLQQIVSITHLTPQ